MRIADVPPVRCSACFAQNPDQPHVDFEVAWDGPVFQSEVVGVNPVAIDDLFICASCMRRAAGLLGLEDAEELRRELDQQTAANEGLREVLASREEYIGQLEGAVAAKPRVAA